MIRLLPWRRLVWLGGAFLMCGMCGSIASAQQKSQTAAQKIQSYDVSRETVLEGKVVQYMANSWAPPLGPHVTVQTGSGTVDVHLGNPRLLEANHFSLNSGDSLRIVGESVTYGTGTHFVARVIQKGNQALTVRSDRGFPLAPMQKFGPQTKGGAL